MSIILSHRIQKKNILLKLNKYLPLLLLLFRIKLRYLHVLFGFVLFKYIVHYFSIYTSIHDVAHYTFVSKSLSFSQRTVSSTKSPIICPANE